MAGRRTPRALCLCCAVLALAAGAASVTWAAEYRSVADAGAILYDAPSVKARKLYVVGAGYPVEIAVTVEGWTKVRDASGELNWVESRLLSERRTVLVRTGVADARESPNDTAPLVFRAEQNVVLDPIEPAADGWLRVRHRDGQTGYIRTSQLWGVQ
ncbi:MAG TPA: SH3 domain-containing protein [Burkholderiales bacterium]|nr:SH3 domain-containing protein [Burkholderiales bacterium]